MPSVNYPVELSAPDISAYMAGNTGVDYITRIDSGKPGPHVMLNALMHGNEICGAITLDHLFKNKIQPTRGILSLGFSNYKAFLRFDPQRPLMSRYVDEDMNRVWVEERLDSDEDSWELRRAREMRAYFESVDYLLDIHSMSTASPAVTLCNGLDKERDLTRKVGFPEHAAFGSGFVVGRRLIEYTPYHDVNDPKTGLLVECGQHWLKDTAVTALDSALYFLKALDMVAPEFFDAHVTNNPPPPLRELEITEGVYSKSNAFRFTEQYIGMEVIEKAGTVIARDGEEDIVTPYDNCVLVMPNHSAGAKMRVVRFARLSE
ncbi:MAG: succinylglutamate desuccinylase/aspartoacylase family protein [Alphaproteobacteria bacterium]|nr:succinylglutamate desuccinylase/aspartoacylase family protein [Alphaproteobacteria bacterium]